MAGSSTQGFAMSSLITHPITEKLAKINHSMWKAQVLAAIRGARLEGYITGKTVAPATEIDGKDNDGKAVKIANPAYEEWLATDQQVLSFLLTSLSKEVLSQVAAKRTAHAAWAEIESMFSSQTRARAVNTRLALATAQKGNMTVAEYFGKMRALGDEMAAAGRPLEDEELVEYILTGLDLDYNPVVSSLLARPEGVSVSELYSQMLAYETRMELMGHGQSSASSANMANQRGRGVTGRGNNRQEGGNNAGANHGGHHGGYQGGAGNNRGGFGRGMGNPNRGRPNHQAPRNNSQQQRPRRDDGVVGRPLCQVCYKKGHTADRCWHRFEEGFVPDPRHVAAAASSYNLDNLWYTDSGVTDHITADLEKLSFRDKYNGGEQIHTASGAGSGHEEHTS